MPNEFARPGYVFVCAACGKTSPNLYGKGVRNGWDESCMLNAVLCIEEKVDGVWVPAVDPQAAKETPHDHG
ncbi:hypothetical protein [Ancylobacter oerskovii]|uniref:Uncharacterized protein n=1 Tax=Ancylobacter oerskovii TaxID=459519 RepID=A0ABW4Z178_9HYPH|nr:hypothetical protein [Ancylobacter oerskovii]MBS7542563.1 hypothetical protein [Ancylobacter oerskovii]